MRSISDTLTQMIEKALELRRISSSELNQKTPSSLSLAASQGPTIVTHRGEPQFLLVPIANTSEYLNAVASNARGKAELYSDERLEKEAKLPASDS